jgi:hypothetical protein
VGSVTTDKHDLSALGREPAGNGLTDSPAGAGHDGDPVLATMNQCEIASVSSVPLVASPR